MIRKPTISMSALVRSSILNKRSRISLIMNFWQLDLLPLYLRYGLTLWCNFTNNTLMFSARIEGFFTGLKITSRFG